MQATNKSAQNDVLETTQLRQLEIASFAEATTLILLLLIAVPLKHFSGWNFGVKVMGPVHGLAFLAYIWFAIQTVSGGDWTKRDIVRLMVVAFIPFGGFYNLRFLSQKVTTLQEQSSKP
jgi:integral membrane protein